MYRKGSVLNNEKNKHKMNCKIKIEVYTDGGCMPNPGFGSWAWAVNKDVYQSGHLENTTNNYMELLAILKAIEFYKKQSLNINLIIYSDSMYCVEGFNTWMHNWHIKGWIKKKGAIKNLEIWKKLFSLKENVSLIWVKGHENNELNNFVDSLCTTEILQHRK